MKVRSMCKQQSILLYRDSIIPSAKNRDLLRHLKPLKKIHYTVLARRELFRKLNLSVQNHVPILGPKRCTRIKMRTKQLVSLKAMLQNYLLCRPDCFDGTCSARATTCSKVILPTL